MPAGLQFDGQTDPPVWEVHAGMNVLSQLAGIVMLLYPCAPIMAAAANEPAVFAPCILWISTTGKRVLKRVPGVPEAGMQTVPAVVLPAQPPKNWSGVFAL